MLANLAEIRTSVRYLINEATEGFWTNTFIDLQINEGQEEFTSETQCLSKFYSRTLQSADIKNNREIRLSSDFIAFDEGGVIYDGKRLIPTTMKELDALAGSDWRDETGTPTHFYQRGDVIGFAPGRPAVGVTVKYYGVERSATLTGSVVTLSGDYRVIGFRRYVRDYAVAQCWYAKGNKEDYMLKMGEFERGVRKCNNVVFGNKTEPFRMIPAYRRGGQGSINTDPLRL
jgi:hypothetical protein